MFKFIHARAVADIVDPSTTLGIEITDRAVAALCRLGNIDGQHGTGDCSYDGEAVAELLWGNRYAPTTPAMGAACAIAMAVYAPADGATFATSRPDLDSLGAMAVLVLRSLGLSKRINHDLVRVIAERDAFVAGPWEPSPLPTEENPWPRTLSTVDASRETAHLGMIASPRRGDFTENMPLADRVAIIAFALLTGFVSADIRDAVIAACGASEHVCWWRDVIEDAERNVLESRRSLARAAHQTGAIRRTHRMCLGPIDCADYGTIGCICEGGAVISEIAIVKVAHAGAIALGYCVAPVVVAFDQATPGKVTIAEYGDSKRRVDFDRLVARLNELEWCAIPTWRTLLPNGEYGPVGSFAQMPDGAKAIPFGNDGKPCGVPAWGGQAKIKGSPQNGGTRLSESTILAIVQECLR